MLLLMTGCIKPQSINYLELKDEKLRLEMYIETILYYILKSDFKEIVFCENSNYEYDYSTLMNSAEKQDKKLEIIKFEGNIEKVLENGKGYGEGEIIDYALDKSKLLKNNSYFYKVTGRLIVKNVNEILRHEDTTKNYFNKNLYSFNSLDTRFWGMKKDDYKENFRYIYETVNDEKLDYLEYVFYRKFATIPIGYYAHSEYPEYIGVSATINAPYEEKSAVLKLCAHMGIFNLQFFYILNFSIFNRKRIISILKDQLKCKIYNTKVGCLIRRIFEIIVLLYKRIFNKNEKNN